MTRVLVLGGTGWLGREVARAAVADGAEVVCLARGVSGDVPEGALLVKTDRRMPGAYDELTGEWDQVIEIAYDLGLVASALDALADRAKHWTLVSTVSVYSDTSAPGQDESAETVEPNDLSQYPDAKVAAERATKARVAADRLLICRPGLIVGPGDPTDRFGYWPARLRRGGSVLAPETDGRHVQVIDVEDLAGWIYRAGAMPLSGVVDGIGTSVTMDDFLRLTAATAGFDGEFVTLDDDDLAAKDVNYWMGPRSLPLWLPLDDDGMMARSGQAFVNGHGVLRPLSETVQRVLEDEIARGIDRPRRSGLTAEDEAAVLESL